MTQVVITEDGTHHEFPDDATPAEMDGALKQHGFVQQHPLRTGLLNAAMPGIPGVMGMSMLPSVHDMAPSLPWLLGGAAALATGGASAAPTLLSALAPAVAAYAGAGTGQTMQNAIDRASGGPAPNPGMDELKNVHRAALMKGALPELAGTAVAGIAGKAAGMFDAATGRMVQSAKNAAKGRALEMVNASDITPEIQQALKAAKSERTAAATATDTAIKNAHAAGAEPVTMGEIINGVIARDEARLGPMSAEDKATRAADIKQRVGEVLQSHSGRESLGRRVVFDLPTAQYAKQAFSKNASAQYGAITRGMAPKPDLDLDIAQSLKSALEDRVAGLADLNKRTQAAMLDVRGVARMDNANHSPSAAELRRLQRGRIAETAATLPQTGEPVTLHVGIGGVGVTPRPPRASTVTNAGAGLFRHGASRAGQGATARTLGWLVNQEQGGR